MFVAVWDFAFRVVWRFSCGGLCLIVWLLLDLFYVCFLWVCLWVGIV